MPYSEHKALVAIDLGAQSCRVSLLRFYQGNPHFDVVHRFHNGPLVTPAGVRWDIEAIFDGVQAGLRLCAGIATEGIQAIGVDGWAVDYVRLDDDGNAIGDPFCYRDKRTMTAEPAVHELVSPARLHALTGIQLLSINTLYQLYADKLAGCDLATHWINIPEFITYRLGGKVVSEYTNATHTQLIDLRTRQWCDEIFEATGLPRSFAPQLVATGSIVGTVRGDLSELNAFRKTQLIVPACHDTASAIAAIPADGDDWAFISSGTWSLVGTVLQQPCVTGEARTMNFTNLGGVGGTICFLKNVNGMWLLRQCMDEWEARGYRRAVADLIEQCNLLPRPAALLQVDDPQLLLPGNMLAKIDVQMAQSGSRSAKFWQNAEPTTVANLILHSLATRYAEVLASIAEITGKNLRRLFVVGGGSRNRLLNRLTAEHTGLQVIAGATESTTIGNFAIQMAALAGDSAGPQAVSTAAVAKWAEKISAGSLAIAAGMDG